MIELEQIICEVAENFSENEKISTKENVEVLSKELSIQAGVAKLIMIAWDQK